MLWRSTAAKDSSAVTDICHILFCVVFLFPPPPTSCFQDLGGEELEAVEYWFLGYLLCPQEGGQASLKLFAGASQRKEYDTPDTHTQTTHDTQKCTGKCSHTCTCSGNKVVRHSATCWSVCLHHSLVVDSSKCELLVQQHHKGIDKEAP